MVLAFTGLRWEEAVAVPIGNVSLDGQCMRIDRTASESGGRQDVRRLYACANQELGDGEGADAVA